MKRLLALALVLCGPALADTNVRPGIIFPGAGTVTPTLSSGGVAQALVAAQPNSSPLTCLFKNPLSAADQGIAAAEAAYINVVGTAVAAGGGNSIVLQPGETLTTGPQTGAISWIAATTSHKLMGVCWQ